MIVRKALPHPVVPGHELGDDVILLPGESLGPIRCPEDAPEPLRLYLPADPAQVARAELTRRQALLPGDPDHVAPTLPAEPPPPDLRAAARSARDAAETGGILFAGIPIATDDRSKVLVLGARRRAEQDPELVTPWSAEDGESYPLTAALVIAVSDAIGDHVDACFRVFAEVGVGIEAGSVTTPSEVEAAFAAIPRGHPAG